MCERGNKRSKAVPGAPPSHLAECGAAPPLHRSQVRAPGPHQPTCPPARAYGRPSVAAQCAYVGKRPELVDIEKEERPPRLECDAEEAAERCNGGKRVRTDGEDLVDVVVHVRVLVDVERGGKLQQAHREKSGSHEPHSSAVDGV
eukprot:scaffold115517_cov31-Tisochrysis_lutea.AAC.2